MPLLERILTMGITGSGKSYQWLKLARSLKDTGAIFRCIDTDNDIDYMLRTQFEDLLPENGGNVYAFPAYDWPEYKQAVYWIQGKLTDEQIKEITNRDQYLINAYRQPIKSSDWVVVDKINNAWSRVQRYFVSNVFDEDMGEYFLEVRKRIREAGGIGKGGKKVVSTALEALDGWQDWVVINRLYDDWILPIVYRVHCHVYAATDVDEVDRGEKDPEIISLFGDYKIKPAGQKKLGGQFHTILLFIPGKTQWKVSTIKDRSNRHYFDKVVLHNLHMQYLVAKAGWSLPEE